MSRRKPKGNNKFQFVATILIAAIATIWLGILGNIVLKQMAPVNQVPDIPQISPKPTPDNSAPITASPLPSLTPSPVPSAVPSPSPSFQLPDNPPVISPPLPPPVSQPVGGAPKYNHLPYEEATSSLVEVGTYYERSEVMVQEAAQAFWTMADNAKREGVNMGPISGFRTIADQDQLFTRQIGRHNGSPEAAARLSAPPGYSEHHTGYTIDIRDRDEETTDLKYDMERTRAYRWLAQNACLYGFELSFPDNNVQGVSFEPWHWRYIGSPKAQAIFANAHQRYPAATNCSNG